MKLSEVKKGVLVRDTVELTTITGEVATCALRPVLGDEEAAALSSARAFAVRHGVADPKAGEPLYDYGLEIAILLVAAVDAEQTDAEPFFDGGEAQLLQHLDRDRIALLYERQRCLQDRVSPRKHALDSGEFFSKVIELARSGNDDESPFDSLRPALLRSFARTLARLYFDSLTPSSPTGGASDASTKSAQRSET